MTLWSVNHPTIKVINTPMVSYIIPIIVACTLCFLQCTIVESSTSASTTCVDCSASCEHDPATEDIEPFKVTGDTENIVEETAEGITEQTAEDVTEQTAEDVTEQTAEGVTEEIVGDVTEQTADSEDVTE